MKYEKFINTVGKKVNTLVLLAVVLIIWGVVAFRVLKWLTPEHYVSDSGQTESSPDMSAPAALNLNYKDPFLYEERSIVGTEAVVHKVERISKPMPSVKYKGALRDKDGVQRAIIEFHGDVSILAIGESIAGMTIHKIAPEFLSIRWNGQLQTLEAQ